MICSQNMTYLTIRIRFNFLPNIPSNLSEAYKCYSRIWVARILSVFLITLLNYDPTTT